MNVSSWFGAPPPSKRPSHRSSSPRRASSPSSTSKTYVVRSTSPTRSTASKGYFVRPLSPARSAASASTSRGFFSRPHQSSTSNYKRRPRDGYISRLVDIIRRLVRDLVKYARENPMKMFMLVVMPLITGGALTGLLARFGIRLPAGLAALAKGAGGSAGAKGGLEGLAGGLGKGGLEQAIGIAKMFI